MRYMYINGAVNLEMYKAVLAFLQKNKGQEVFFVIDSHGGLLFQGFAIANAMKSHGNVTTIVNGIAASAASIISVAGNRRGITPNSRIVIHGPWSQVSGNKGEMAKTMEMLEESERELVAFYQQSARIPHEILEKSMKGEEWFSANVALNYGLVDFIDKSPALFNEIPQQELETMEKNKQKTIEIYANLQGVENETQETPETSETPETQAAPRIEVSGDGWQNEIRREISNLRNTIGTELSRIGNVEEILARMQDNYNPEPAIPEPENNNPKDTPVSARQQFVEEQTELILAYVRGETAITYDRIAENCLRQENLNVPMDKGSIYSSAFNSAGPAAGTALFPLILGNAFQRVVLEGFEENPLSTWREWAQSGPLSTFLPTPIAGMLFAGPLDEVLESGEVKVTQVTEAGNTVQAAEYANRFPITERALRNDTANIFDDIPRAMGEKADETINQLVYGVLKANAALSSGGNLFVDTRNSIDGALTADNLSTLEAMSMLVDKPRAMRYLIVPPQLRATAETLINAREISGTTNIHFNRYTVVVAPQLGDEPTKYYLASDRGTVFVGFVDGNRPIIQQQQQWGTLALDTRVILRCGSASKGWRGLFRGGNNV
jgi:ATP-dependent protease ClpP protease subunit